MSLNKSTGNMYPWITHTWNPVRGECPYRCSYCYVRRMMRRYGKEQRPLYLDEKELKTNLGQGNYIFVCSGCDLFHPDVPDEWINTVHARTLEYPGNQYLWHTKNPQRLVEVIKPGPNDVACVTIESNIPWPGISKAPQPSERVDALKRWNGRKMITVEPVIDFDVLTFSEMILSCKPEQVNIGADSGHNRLPEPSPEKIAALIEALRSFTKVDLKDNLERLYKET